MDATTLSGWIVAIGALLTILLQVRYRGEDMSKMKLDLALKPLREDIDRHQIEMDAMATTMISTQAGLTDVKRHLTDHELMCDQRAIRMEQMQAEIRSDIKRLIAKAGA